MTSFLFANAPSSYFKQGNINILIPELWTIQKPIKAGSLVMSHNSIPATINIFQHYFLDPVTANGLQELRSATVYDGWMNILSRPGSKKETLMANAKDSHVAVYVRQELNDNLKLNEFLTAEYYFVVDSNYYILSIETTKHSWKHIQSEWKYFLDSFWIGNGKRPSFHPLDISFNDWIQEGNFNNMNYINASPSIQRPLTIKWEVSVSANVANHDLPIVTSGNDLFVIINNQLSKIDSSSGNTLWKFSINDSINPTYLSCMNALLFLITKDSNRIIALSTDTGEVVYTISINSLLSPPVFTQDSIYLNDSGIIRKYSTGSGFLIWSHDNYRFQEGAIFVSEHHLIGQISTNEFVALNPGNGSLSWKTKPIKLLMPPTCTNKILLAPIKEGSLNKKLVAFDLKDGSIQWSLNKSILNFSFNHPISATNEFSIISFSIRNDHNEKQHFLMRVDNQTGEIDWEYPSTFGYSRPLLSSFFIFTFNKISNKLVVIDSFTGTEVPHPPLSNHLSQFILIKQSIVNLFSVENKLIMQSLH